MRYATNKWVGLDIGGGSQYLNTQMYDYLQKNGWGLWLEGIEWSDFSGSTNQQAAVISWIQTNLEPILSVIKKNYTIPIRIDAKDFANSATNSLTACQSNYGQIFDYLADWANGTKGDCLKQYWFEGRQDYPAILRAHESNDQGA